ncbi:MAG: LPXTG cell wall anchor domain-containing protein, partial [Nanoarchaeota archaeon]
DCSAREEIPTGKSKSFFLIILAVFVVGIIGVYIYKKKRKRYKINKKFYEATKRLHARKKNIKHSQIDDLIQEVRYGKKKGERK